jgi:hypothetical protein
MTQSRECYFRAEKEVAETVGNANYVENLASILKQNTHRKYPSERSFFESLSIFFRRSDIQWICFGGVVCLMKVLGLIR